MANFSTHIAFSTALTGLATTALLNANIINTQEGLYYWALGSLGGILPDIDSDHSTSISLVFTLLGLGVAVLVITRFVGVFSIVELWLLGISAYALVRHVMRNIFAHFTVHRGIFHSYLAGLLFLLLVTDLSAFTLGMESVQAWMAGCFVFLGFVLHLLLDELYSVDIANTRIKRSFGTAMKFFNAKDLPTSFSMAAVIAVLYWISPDFTQFKLFWQSPETLDSLFKVIWPQQDWFHWQASA